MITARCFPVMFLTIGMAIACAQSSQLPSAADPSASPSALKYDSPFADFQPFRDQDTKPWKEANRQVADNLGMGSMGMKGTHGHAASGPDSQPGAGPSSKQGATDHDMSLMKKEMGDMNNVPGKPTPVHKQVPTHAMSKQDAGAHDMGSMNKMPGVSTRGGVGNEKLAMAKQHGEPGQQPIGQTASITGTGVVQAIDKANSKVKLTHDPIAAMGWPRMTMFFRVKDSSLADEVRVGDKVQFSLEKAASGYVITAFQKAVALHGVK